MIKKILFSALIISIISCGQESSKEHMTTSGYKYMHVKTKGEPVKEGDYVYITIKMIGSDGKVLQEIGEGPNMPIMQMPTADKPLPMPNPVIDMLFEGGLGDSMTLVMPIDSFPNQSNPAFAGLDHIKYVTCIKDIKGEVEYKADVEEQRLNAEKAGEALKERLPEVEGKAGGFLKEYNAGKMDVQTTPDGLKYVIHSPGEGTLAAVDNKATVNYYGTFMDGKLFDSSFKSGRPFTFTVGRGEAIRGWDLGIPLLKPGGSASFFIPYDLAYGEAGRPPIPGKTDLYFYVELVEVN